MSGAWEFFVPIDSKSAKCCKCSKQISTNQGSTSGLIRHLTVHQITVKRSAQNHSDETPNQKIVKTNVSNQPSILNFVNRQTLSELVSRLAAKDGLSVRQITNSSVIRHLF